MSTDSSAVCSSPPASSIQLLFIIPGVSHFFHPLISFARTICAAFCADAVATLSTTFASNFPDCPNWQDCHLSPFCFHSNSLVFGLLAFWLAQCEIWVSLLALPSPSPPQFFLSALLVMLHRVLTMRLLQRQQTVN